MTVIFNSSGNTALKLLWSYKADYYTGWITSENYSLVTASTNARRLFAKLSLDCIQLIRGSNEFQNHPNFSELEFCEDVPVSSLQKLVQALSPVPVELVVAFSICDDIKLTWVLYVACTLRLILNISRIVSSFPWRISNSFQVCQKLAVTWKIEFVNGSKRKQGVHVTDGNSVLSSNVRRLFISLLGHRSGSSRSRLL